MGKLILGFVEKILVLILSQGLVCVCTWKNKNFIVKAEEFPAMFVFGDSLVDCGNNNYLSSLARSDYLPYGIDFYAGPTGRFSNGKTIIDFLGNFSLSSPFICFLFSPTGKYRNSACRRFGWSSSSSTFRRYHHFRKRYT